VTDGSGEGRPIGARVKLTDISSRAWEHPADRGALTALRQLRGFDYVLRKLAGLWNERALRLVYLGAAVRVDHHQFPGVYQLYTQAASTLDVRDLPALYVYSDPQPRAMALGIDHPFVVVNSGMIDMLDDDELCFILGGYRTRCPGYRSAPSACARSSPLSTSGRARPSCRATGPGCWPRRIPRLPCGAT
jgi:hypothetical protein